MDVNMIEKTSKGFFLAIIFLCFLASFYFSIMVYIQYYSVLLLNGKNTLILSSLVLNCKKKIWNSHFLKYNSQIYLFYNVLIHFQYGILLFYLNLYKIISLHFNKRGCNKKTCLQYPKAYNLVFYIFYSFQKG